MTFWAKTKVSLMRADKITGANAKSIHISPNVRPLRLVSTGNYCSAKTPFHVGTKHTICLSANHCYLFGPRNLQLP